MTIEEALDALIPYRSKIPTEALNLIRSNWDEAEPALLAEMDRCIDTPLEDEHSALLLYALYLCAEMQCEAAFARYIAICRLPTLLMDALIGDILTQNMPEMLARTCAGRVEPLQVLVEDEAVYEFARSAGLDALHALVLTGGLSREELEHYCMELLSHRLQKRPSYIWDEAITIAENLRLTEALPLIEEAYQYGWANPGMQSFEEVSEGMAQPLTEEKLKEWRKKIQDFKTEREIAFFAHNWSEEEDFPSEDTADLLQEPQAARRQRQLQTGGKIGRNDSCPCGSGKKYKKCCIDQKNNLEAMGPLNTASPLSCADEWIEAGYYYFNKKWHYKALTCWWHAWQEAEKILPETIRDPKTEECDRLFSSCDFFSNWLVDYQSLIEDNLERDPVAAQNGLIFCQKIVARFPDMNCSLTNNFIETTSYLLLALGKSEQAFSLLEQMIEQHPKCTQGYVVLAALLSLDAQRFNLHPDFDRAQQLLLQARENATDCEDWDVDLRLEDLTDAVRDLSHPAL
jgi:tetratricopeptide (TPR) repeat protein